VLGRELLPYEAANGSHTPLPQGLDGLELVVLVEERELELVLAPPRDELVARDPVIGRLGYARLVPDARAIDERGSDVAGAGRAGEHTRLVSERVECRAQVPRDDPLPAVEPICADPDPQAGQG
jgi:hypothetical protein